MNEIKKVQQSNLSEIEKAYLKKDNEILKGGLGNHRQSISRRWHVGLKSVPQKGDETLKGASPPAVAKGCAPQAAYEWVAFGDGRGIIMQMFYSLTRLA